MFIGKAMMIAAAASAATIPSSWQPVAVDDWHVRPLRGPCAMIVPLGRTDSDELLGALTFYPHPDGSVAMTINRKGWTIPEERGTIKIWFDKGYGMLRPMYDQPADFDPADGDGMVFTVFEGSFITIASMKSSIDVIVEGSALGAPQRMTIPLGDLETAVGKLDACLTAN